MVAERSTAHKMKSRMSNEKNSYRDPPLLTSQLYEVWRHELDLWELITDIEKKERAVAVVLSLTGQARKIGLSIEKKSYMQTKV